MRAFASDNYAGAHPRVLDAVARANDGAHARAYGADEWTARFQELIHAEFGSHARAFPVFNGTGANVLCVEALTRPWEAVVCSATAHLHVDECGAPERTGRKLLPVDTPHGKLAAADIAPLLARAGDEHAVQPRLVSITQSSELGTVYDRDELAALAEEVHAHGLLLHVDGARLFNAAAALDGSLTAAAAGADAVSLGATKAGALGAEAVVFLGPELGEGARYLRKRATQLASKMRFFSAQLVALLEDGLGLELARHANAMAARLAANVAEVPGVTLTQPTQANGVFAILPAGIAERLQGDWPFYVWDDRTGEVRWMCSWDTTPGEVDAFAAAVRDAVSV